MTSSESKGKIVVGKVVSDKMNKTIVVEIARIVRHPKYGKIMRRRTKLYVHDEQQVGKIGNMVRVQESRPISKKKCWRLLEVISQ